MRKYLILGLMLMCVMSLTAQNNKYECYVEVTGKATREVTPDEIYLSITIDQESTNKGKVSVAEQEQQMIAAFKHIGINVDKALTVADMSSDMQTYLLRKNQVQTSKSFQLKLSSPDQINKVFEELAKLNIPNTYITKSTYSDIDGIKKELRVEAMKNARETAMTLAEACGQKAGSAITIVDNNYMSGETSNYNRYSGMLLARAANLDAAEAEDEGSAVEFKKLKFSYTIDAKFVLLPLSE